MLDGKGGSISIMNSTFSNIKSKDYGGAFSLGVDFADYSSGVIGNPNYISEL